MENRHRLKIVGRSGQGINTLGEIIAKSLKRAGFSVFAYREYPSLIKGGHATYQIDWSNETVTGSTIEIDALMVLNRQGTDWHLDEIKPGGIIFHDIENPRINDVEAEIIKNKGIKFVYIPALELAKKVGGNEITSNMVSLGYIWKQTGLDAKYINDVVSEVFASKPEFVKIDIDCLTQGYQFALGQLPDYRKRLLKPDEIKNEEKSALHLQDEQNFKNYLHLEPNSEYSEKLLLNGSEAIAIGAIRAGVRIHYGYPMTPSTPVMAYLANTMHETGIVVKQAEDEITAAAMAIGSMHMGTRAMTATSGGGFDLMTEHVSLAAITETPFVCVLAQRPGPATGLPTWTSQGDLLLAIFSAHGEYTRFVLAPKDPEDAFYCIQEAFNVAEKYQIPVVLLSDKHLGESLYTSDKPDQNKIPFERGQLITEPTDLEKLKSTDRYKFTENGVSPRWLPGSKAADFNANSDEHDEEGNVTEESEPALKMIQKRIRKHEALKNELPEPEILFNNIDLSNAEGKVSFIGWGSTYGAVQDAMKYYEKKNIKVDYINITYLWPLKTDLIEKYLKENPDTILIEGNHNGQLGQLIKMETGLDIKHRLLKWDGRPFFIEEIIKYVDDNILTDQNA